MYFSIKYIKDDKIQNLSNTIIIYQIVALLNVYTVFY